MPTMKVIITTLLIVAVAEAFGIMAMVRNLFSGFAGATGGK